MRPAGHQANLVTRATQRSGVVAPDSASADDANLHGVGVACGYFFAAAVNRCAYSPYPSSTSFDAGMKRIDAEFMQ